MQKGSRRPKPRVRRAGDLEVQKAGRGPPPREKSKIGKKPPAEENKTMMVLQPLPREH